MCAAGGGLATAGGLVFYGNMEGQLKAVDANTGAVLWQFGTGAGIRAGPVTYAIEGKQYIAITTGRLALPRGVVALSAVPAPAEGSAVFAFALPEH